MQSKSQAKLTAGAIDYIGKVPPQAVELEAAILGAVLLESDALPTVLAIINRESFYKDQHQIVFDALREMYEKGKQIDLLTVTEYLRASGNLENVGGALAVTMLTDNIASALHIEDYCRIVLEKHMKREIIKQGSESVRYAYDDTTDAFDALGQLEQGVKTVNGLLANNGSLRHVGDITANVRREAERRERLYKSGECTGIKTGINRLDKFTAGWQPGDLVVLAGRPSMGKTALMLHFAISAGVPCCVYSLEMSDISLVNRLVLSLCDIDPGRFRAGAMTAQDWEQFEIAERRLKQLPIYIDENPVASTRYIRAHSKQMHDRGLCDMVLVDYLQLVDMRSDQVGRNREQDVSQASREFKIMAKALGVPVILLSQLSRACELRADKKPMLSDLRESGAIEQDADVVLFAYRPAYYGLNDEYGNSQEGTGFILISKGRNIGVGEVVFSHNPSMTKIYDYDPGTINTTAAIAPNTAFYSAPLIHEEQPF